MPGMSTPNVEPTSITAGDTLTWTRSLADYLPASGWVLSYSLTTATAKIDITGSAQGSDHLINVLAAASSVYVAGDYAWQAYVTNGTERRTIGTGRITIRPNLATQVGGLDARSAARRILDALLVAFEQAALGRAFVTEYDIAGRRMKFSGMADWEKTIQFWRRQVAVEDRAEKLARGQSSGRRIMVRF